MKCISPYFRKGLALNCGKCYSCLSNRRRDWTNRIIFESLNYDNVTFLTLTYNEDNIPLCKIGGRPTLKKYELQGFIKRLRYYLGDRKIRYFACGEYGGQTHRPHYHLILFNVNYSTDIKAIEASWPFGFIVSYPFMPSSANYVAGYVTKKLVPTRKSKKQLDILFKNDRFAYDTYINSIPEVEFNLVSRRPGLGYCFVEKLVNQAFLQGDNDVISFVNFNGRRVYLPKYVKNKLRELVLSKEQIKSIKDGLMYDHVLNNVIFSFKNEYDAFKSGNEFSSFYYHYLQIFKEFKDFEDFIKKSNYKSLINDIINGHDQLDSYLALNYQKFYAGDINHVKNVENKNKLKRTKI